ncbi:MAG: extracellular solute-binding protein [Hungatella sp.]|nr:extracellular solute-binding protein [Hungatella sp.]
MKKRTLSLLLTAAMTATALAGCGGSQTTTGESTQAEGANSGAGASTGAGETKAEGAGAGAAEFSYPMAAGDKLSYWCELTTTVSANYASLGDTPFAKGWQKETGAQIEFLHPPTGQLKEQFSLILADGNLPDLMEYNWMVDYPGGPEKAIKDGVILPLNDVFEQYCPNLTAYLKANPDIDKMIKTDEGHYYVFPFIRGEDKLCNTIGLMLREDWLEELNLEVPTTIDEWHTVLTAFKEKKGAAAPYCFEYTNAQYLNSDPFAYAFETNRSFYLGSDGKAHFGAAEENYKDFLATMAQWYAEGLIDPDLATLGNDQVSAKITNGTAGASMGQAGSRMGTWTTAARSSNPTFKLVAAPPPTLEKGAKAEFGQIENKYSGRASVAITTSCKDVERAARLMDYAYGEAGHLYFNFGTEGESYNMVEGYPTYTDTIMKNPEGLPVSQAMSAYIRGNYNGPFVQDIRYLEQYYTLEEQKATGGTWGDSNGKAHVMPPVTPTSDESREFSTIMNEINTYRDEMTLKFIFGTESLDNFDEYVKNIENMGLSRALEIQNAALERYNAR